MELSFDAVVFDLDGVVTDTASVHSAAWKRVFDAYLREREKKYGEPFREFTIEGDYLPYVDGKPRYKGVESFLKSRNIDIPFGDPSDPPGRETCCGLGNRKNKAFNEILKKEGVKVYPSTVSLMDDLKSAGIRLGVASSSKNCRQVLESAGLLGYFDTRVDGEVSAELGLKGKPEPDIFTTACVNMGVSPYRTVVVEDAVSGVQAGRRGNFGMVLGIAREGNVRDLKINGADMVVEDIFQLNGIEGINDWFDGGLQDDGWKVRFFDRQPSSEKAREVLTATGNGFVVFPGKAVEGFDGEGIGGFMSGVQRDGISGAQRDGQNGRDESDLVTGYRSAGVTDRQVPLVVAPDWLNISFSVDNGDWFDLSQVDILFMERCLDMARGLLTVKLMVRDKMERITQLYSSRLVNMASRHQMGVSYSIKPVNYTAHLSVCTRLDTGFAADTSEGGLNDSPPELLERGRDGGVSYLTFKDQSGVEVAAASICRLFADGSPRVVPWTHRETPAGIEALVRVDAPENMTVTLEKFVSVYNSLMVPRDEILQLAKKEVAKTFRFSQIVGQSSWVWNSVWEGADIKIEGDRRFQKLLRLHVYHMIVALLHSYSGPGYGKPVWDKRGNACWGCCDECESGFLHGEIAVERVGASMPVASDLGSFYFFGHQVAQQLVRELEFRDDSKFPEKGDKEKLFSLWRIICDVAYRKLAEGGERDVFAGETAGCINIAAPLVSFVAGVAQKEGAIHICPRLPGGWESLSLNCCIGGYLVFLRIGPEEFEIISNKENDDSFKFISFGKTYVIRQGESVIVNMSDDEERQ